MPAWGNDHLSDPLIESFQDWTECFSIDCRAVNDWLLEARNDLTGLELLAKKGIALTDQAGRSLAASIDGAVLRKLAAEVGLIDDELRRVGKSRVWTTQLTSFFETELEQAQDNSFRGLLAVWREAYRGMQSRIRFLNHEIDVVKELFIH